MKEYYIVYGSFGYVLCKLENEETLWRIFNTQMDESYPVNLMLIDDEVFCSRPQHVHAYTKATSETRELQRKFEVFIKSEKGFHL
jgi:hypothetical protein